ncbi:MAG TPA: hypothetical protein VNJ51_10155 [Candidatus Dormibacteraeota bacterium]|nr:hypothetical protein [Candidatus Dormibacteraeota bacterium]
MMHSTAMRSKPSSERLILSVVVGAVSLGILVGTWFFLTSMPSGIGDPHAAALHSTTFSESQARYKP